MTHVCVTREQLTQTSQWLNPKFTLCLFQSILKQLRVGWKWKFVGPLCCPHCRVCAGTKRSVRNRTVPVPRGLKGSTARTGNESNFPTKLSPGPWFALRSYHGGFSLLPNREYEELNVVISRINWFALLSSKTGKMLLCFVIKFQYFESPMFSWDFAMLNRPSH